MKSEDWDYPNPTCITVAVNAKHIDALGHTNNCEYLKWCEEAAWAHSEALGLGLDTFQTTGFGMAAAKTELNYLAPTYLEDTLVVGTWIVKTDGKLYTDRAYQIIRPSDGKTVLRGLTKFVCISLNTGKISRMPVEFGEGYKRSEVST